MKRFIRRVMFILLRMTGLTRNTALDVAGTLAGFRGRLAALFVTSIVAPLLELLFLGALFAIVSAETRPAVLARIDQVGLRALYEAAGGDAQYGVIIAAAAAVLLIVQLGVRALSEHLLVDLKYRLDVHYMHRVVEAYLVGSPQAVAHLGRDRVASAAMRESLGYGMFAFSLLSIVSVANSVMLFLVSAFLMSPLLLLVTTTVAALTFLVARRGFRVAKAIARRRIASHTEEIARLLDVMQAHRVVKVDGGERYQSGRVLSFLLTSQRWRLDKGHNEAFVVLLSEGLLYGALLTIVSLSLFVFGIGTGVLVVFLVLMTRLQKYLASVQQKWLQVRSLAPSLEAVEAVVEQCLGEVGDTDPLAVRPEVKARMAPPLTAALEQVTFGYLPGPGEVDNEAAIILKDVSLTCGPGDRILLQGPSGQGKSTLVATLMGLLTPSAGRVTVNGVELDSEGFLAFREHLGYASPDLHVFRHSLRDNLCTARDYPETELLEAIRLARLEDVLAQQPQGLDGFIGENGSRLSLGERQRIMLARVFLKRASFVVLDEATSNLDQALEHQILTDLFDRVGPRGTVVVITHKKPAGITFTHEFGIFGGRLVARDAALAAGT